MLAVKPQFFAADIATIHVRVIRVVGVLGVIAEAISAVVGTFAASVDGVGLGFCLREVLPAVVDWVAFRIVDAWHLFSVWVYD
jgi:hypothetical protein